ncbi:hypothetical protein G9X67_34680 [Rhizobium sp. WYCCWR 11152]|uniref:hypothetical protein n=1 Tax=Rhizobium sp. WYCCWR 11152 TaxID=2692316 RepID=UPI0014925CF5|nr:hypothetical protein [Rhizobium sp. WYCCWR 11152]NNU70399.1 hypothetical protein [Rhizobium sp. WYCCWR 11152]
MAYVQKTNLEDVAQAIQNLKWHEMITISQYLASVEAPDKGDRDFWASILHDMSSDIMTAYEARCNGEG